MNCPRCQEPAQAEQRFCEACGAPLFEAAAEVHPTESAASEAAHQTPSVTAQISACQCPPGQGKPDQDGYCEICGVKMKLAGTATPPPRAEGFEQIVDARLALVSHPGRRHPLNEDAGWVGHLPDGRTLLVVADGVSSCWNAKLAASIAVGTVREKLAEIDGSATPDEALRQALEAAHEAVKAMADHPEGSVMDEPGTTIVAVLISGEQRAIGWVGDSRAYLIPEQRDGGAETALTQDDSWVNMMVSEGKMSLEMALADKQARYVTQTLGMRDDAPDIHVEVGPYPKAHHLMLCTDGLWNYFALSGMVATAVHGVDAAADAVTLCRTLVAQANAKGGKDNVTVALLLADV